MLPEFLVQHAVPFSLVLSRMAGVFIAAPMLGGTAIPLRLKSLLALMTTAAVYPAVAGGLIPPAVLDLAGVAPVYASELTIGFTMGILASVPMMGMEMAGALIGQQMGFGLAKVYNPEADFDSDILGRLLFYLAFGAFLALGGLEAMFLVLSRSFETAPVGALIASRAPVEELTAVLTAGVELAMRVSAPALGIVLLLLLAFGVVSKTMPQINVMSEGFAVKIIGGLAVLAGSLHAIDIAAGDEVSRVMGLVADWVSGLGAA